MLKKDLGESAEAEGKKFDWLTFKNLEQSVRDDIKIIADSPLIPNDINVHGFIYRVRLVKYRLLRTQRPTQGRVMLAVL